MFVLVFGVTITSIISNNTTYDLGILSSIRRLHKAGNWSPYAKVGRYILTRERATALSQSVVSCLRFFSFSAYGVGIVRERLQLIAQIIYGVRCVSLPICLEALLVHLSTWAWCCWTSVCQRRQIHKIRTRHMREVGFGVTLSFSLQVSAALSWCMSVYAGDYWCRLSYLNVNDFSFDKSHPVMSLHSSNIYILPLA